MACSQPKHQNLKFYPWLMVYVDLSGPFLIITQSKKHSLFLLTIIYPEINKFWLEIVKAANKSETSIQDLFHNIWLARYWCPQFIDFENEGKFKRDFKKRVRKTIMALKPKQQQDKTIYAQENAIIERIHKLFNYMLRSFDLENNHKNLEEQFDNPFDYFLQSTLWLPRY
jgi:hypothetical protein